MKEQKEILLKENFKLKELELGCGRKISHDVGIIRGVETATTTCKRSLLCIYCKRKILKQEGRIEGIKFMFRKIKSSERKKSEGRTGGMRSGS